MVVYLNVEHFLYGLFYGLDTGIAEFHNFTGIGKYHVVVLPVKIRFFVMRLVLAELMFSGQAAFQKKFYGVVQGGPAHPVVLVLHFNVERLYVEMVVTFIYFLEYSIALRSFPVAVVFEETGEDILHYLLVLFIVHNRGHQKN